MRKKSAHKQDPTPGTTPSTRRCAHQPKTSRRCGCAWVVWQEEARKPRPDPYVSLATKKFQATVPCNIPSCRRDAERGDPIYHKELPAPTKCAPTLRSASVSVGDCSNPSGVSTLVSVHEDQLGAYIERPMSVSPKGEGYRYGAARSHQPPQPRGQTAACSKRCIHPQIGRSKFCGRNFRDHATRLLTASRLLSYRRREPRPAPQRLAPATSYAHSLHYNSRGSAAHLGSTATAGATEKKTHS